MSIIKKNIRYLSHFATGQFLLQSFNLINGFFLLRWLSISQQAKFGVAFSIQSLILSLSDLGFTGSIIALVGNRINDKQVVGAYIQSAKRLRNYLFFFSCGIVMLILPFIIRKQSWSYPELALLLTPVLLAVFWQADCSLYDSTLVMQKKMKELYRPQITMAAVKLSTNYFLFSMGLISAFTALVINAFALLFNGKTYKRKALPYVDISKNNKYDDEFKEMIRYLKPLFPSLVFNAFYGQIQIFIISVLGKTTSIADIAALGKLSQMFLFLTALNGIIVAPLIAKLSPGELFKKYVFVLIISISVACCIFLLSLIVPNLFLFLLGPKFQHLKNVLYLMILISCINYLTGTIWTMSSARKWVYLWATTTYIGLIIICQILGFFIFNLSTTLGVLQLSLMTSIGILFVHICIAVVGFRKLNLNLSLNVQ